MDFISRIETGLNGRDPGPSVRIAPEHLTILEKVARTSQQRLESADPFSEQLNAFAKASHDFRDFESTLNTAEASGRYKLALSYITGDAQRKDVPQGWRFLKEAQTMNYPPAMLFFASLLRERNQSPNASDSEKHSNDQRCYTLRKAAAELHDAEGINDLGICHKLGVGTPRDLDLAEALYMQAADMGFASAQWNYAFTLLQSKTLSRKAIAMKYLQLAGAQGHEKALQKLKDLQIELVEPRKAPVQTEEEAPVEPLVQSLELLRNGKNLKSLQDLFHFQVGLEKLANIGLHTLGTTLILHDQEFAGVLKLEEAAKLGHAPSMVALANRLRERNKLDISPAEKRQNENDCFSYREAAADYGSTEGINDLGLCYKQGIGVPIDLKKAEELYLKAADLGFASAQWNYGLTLLERPADEERAIEYLTMAASQGHEKATKLLIRIGKIS